MNQIQITIFKNPNCQYFVVCVAICVLIPSNQVKLSFESNKPDFFRGNLHA